MTVVIQGLSPASHARHGLHDQARDWPETNCYVDLWIEMIAALGHDPVAGLGFTVTQDFEGDQFTFFKFPSADLEVLYGVSVLELAIFDNTVAHVETQASRGRIALVEVDGFYLPDTKGVSYRTEHTKTTIAVNSIDPATRFLGYFHNAGYFALSGDDFDGLFGRLPDQMAVADRLLPYTEFVKLAPVTHDAALPKIALRLLEHHLGNRPRANPIRAYKANFGAHAERLMTSAPEFFHKYTFNVLRQLGANHELLSSYLIWLRSHGINGLDRAIAKTQELSGTAKAMQFQLARSVARRSFANYDATLDRMADAYDLAFGDLVAVFGGGQNRMAS
ncbi:MAG: DUF1839 family protein [Hyphomicrobiaceae bacterium]|nr:DUF1839 family protein [Hyphomicrobiaceae bacterium]